MVEHAAREGSSRRLESILDRIDRQEVEHTATNQSSNMDIRGRDLWLVKRGNDPSGSRFV